MTFIRIDANRIDDEESFHTIFSDAFGFPDFYGRNMNAWIDCMGYLDDPAGKMSSIHVAPGQNLGLVIDNAQSLKQRCPALFDALVECAAFVNWRCAERGQPPLLALAMHL
jgi:hypothetical protein